MKVCNKRGRDETETSFVPSKYTKCNECHAAYLRSYRALNVERTREIAKAWRAANPDKVTASCQKWKAAHLEKSMQRQSTIEPKEAESSESSIENSTKCLFWIW